MSGQLNSQPVAQQANYEARLDTILTSSRNVNLREGPNNLGYLVGILKKTLGHAGGGGFAAYLIIGP